MPNTVQIIDRNGDKRVVISEAQLARTMVIGTNWVHLRVGIVLGIDGPEANMPGTPRLLMGLNSGDTDLPFGEPPPGHFLGIRTNQPIWSWSGTNYYDVGDNEFEVYKNVQGVETTDSISALGTGNFVFQDSKYSGDFITDGVSTYFIDFNKTAPNEISVRLTGSVNNSSFGMTEDQFRQAMTLVDPVTSPGFGLFIDTAYSPMAVDEVADGGLDTICIAWDRLDNFEISKIAFSRIA